MAYMSQSHKKEIAPIVKAILKQYGLKGTLSVRNHSTLVLNISKGQFNIGEDHISVNPYWIESHYKGQMREAMQKLVDAMHGPRYFDKSEPQTDYFNCSHYIEINFGKYDKPYIYEGKK